MISTLPANLLAKIRRINPSGYCGAISSIRHMGVNKTTSKPNPHRTSNALVTVAILLFFMFRVQIKKSSKLAVPGTAAGFATFFFKYYFEATATCLPAILSVFGKLVPVLKLIGTLLPAGDTLA